MLDQLQAKPGQLALLANLGIRQPNRRHQVALGQRGEDERVALVGLVGQRSDPLDPLGVGDLDVQRNSSSTFFWLVYWLEGERALPSG